MADKKENVQSIERALNILEELYISNNLGLTDLCDRLELNKSTVHRILQTLIKRNYVEKDPSTEKYKLGIKLFELGSFIFSNYDIRKVSEPFLIELMEKTNETVHLVVRNQNHGIYIDKIECEQSIRMFSQIGKTVPLHCTAVGKVLLSSLSREKIDKIYGHKELESFTENTITNWEELFMELKEIAEKGYSVDEEEFTKDICCIAAPIKDFRGQVIAAISISGPTYRIKKENIDQFIGEVKSCALKISKRIGYCQ